MQLRFDNCWAYVEDTPEKVIDKIRTGLSALVPGHRYTWLFKSKQWDGHASLLDEQNKFPTGLIHKVLEMKLGAVELIDERPIERITLSPLQRVQLRDYQYQSLTKAFTQKMNGFWWPRGVIKSPTGSGKSVLAAGMIEMTKLPTIIIVNRRDLIRNMTEKFEKFGISWGTLHKCEVKGDPNVLLTTVQGLMSWDFNYKKLDRGTYTRQAAEATKKLLLQYKQVFIDEAHLTGRTLEKANLFTRALTHLPNAFLRWGLTATPFMRGEYNDMQLEGTTGRLLFEVQKEELFESGALVPVDVTMHKIPKLNIPKHMQEWPECRSNGIVHNDYRNNKIVELAITRPKPVIILVQQIEHGRILTDALKERDLRVRYVHGKVDVETRAEVIKEVESGKVDVVIGSTIWDEGIDMPSIRTVIRAAGGRSKRQLIQQAGRGQRPYEGKAVLFLDDFLDETPGPLRKHARERLKIWKSEGYSVTIK